MSSSTRQRGTTTTTTKDTNGNQKISPLVGAGIKSTNSSALLSPQISKLANIDPFDSSKDETSSDDEQTAASNNADGQKSTDPPQSKYKKLMVRSVMGAAMIFFFIGILRTDHFIVSLFVMALQLLVFKEMVSLRYVEAKEKKIPRFRTLAWFFLLSAFYFFYAKPILLKISSVFPEAQHFVKFHLWHSFSLYCIGFVSFIFTLRKGVYRYQFSQFTWILMILLMVVVQSNFIISNIYQGLIWFILPVSIIVCNDIFAYFNGFFLGKKFIQKPLMKISPNKTWEGFIGATIWTLIFAYYFAGYLIQFDWVICPKGSGDFLEPLHCTPDPVFLQKEFIIPTEVSTILTKYLGITLTSLTFVPIQLHALVLALFGSLIAPFGGFFASGIKRAYKIKDFDNIFPGHGGVTDRTDCQFIMGLFIHVYYYTFIKTNELDASQIWQGLLMLPVDQQVQIFQKLQNVISSAAATTLA
ncbi:CDP-diacylglycerol synthase [Cavenderia fasciculata]|uniref:Phosphatidate cytidylyltransferase n=1 Tax=Cavenderia fasciculata TaxID=261658 RepID=F4Q024_CACFS|nr:CDP-diacylglycerol synthase [Cavenderia fasciculata]EGG18938.1 CDP-diacylglycerol synthase [Cavenderia fasciculata]|eukprot:XP_004357400.1 CDP-diacylglycerol synthase [Cavenderia fasciculata]